MHIFAIIHNGRRSYRVVTRDNRGVLSCYLPTRQAQRMLRNLGGAL